MLFISRRVLAANRISQTRSNSLKDKLQIVIDTTERPQFNVFALSEPVRLIIDIKAQAMPSYRNRLSFRHRGVTLVRTGVRSRREIRYVLDLAKDFPWQVYALPAGGGRSNRLVIDVFDRAAKPRLLEPSRLNIAARAADTKAGRNPQPMPGSIRLESLGKANDRGSPPPLTVLEHPVAPRAQQSVPQPIPMKPAKSVAGSGRKQLTKVVTSRSAAIRGAAKKTRQQRDIVVMIDPGHGGKDPGAIGLHGTREKDVVLKIARRLKKKIDATTGMRAIMTRHSDHYISLRGRLFFARKHKADLFVSIHADAFRDRSVRGSTVFILSNHGATSESARWLAKGENAKDLVYGVDIADYDKDVGDFLIGMQQGVTIESSYALAKDTIKNLKKVGKTHQNRVERAGFVVLKSPDIPSMLVETAFISNPGEEALLRTPAYQDKVAQAVAYGIHDYFNKYIPRHLLRLQAS